MKKKFIVLTTIALTCLLLLEIFLRIAGFKPWKNFENNQNSTSTYHKKLGWKLKEGKYFINSINNSGEYTKVTIMNDGSRKTGKTLNVNKNIIVIGGSFSHGSGVSDEDTYAYKLGKIMTNFNIYNFGQPGYGTIQSLLLLKEEIQKIKKTEFIIYGFIDHHIQRNIARSEWLNILLKASSKNNKFKPSIPYGIIDKNQNLIIKPLLAHATFPLRKNSSLITVIEKIYMKQTTRQRKKFQLQVLFKSIDEINKIAKSNDSKLFVVNLSLNKKRSDKKLSNYLTENRISYIDCRPPNFKEYKIKNDYHPNLLGHEFYSKCIFKEITKN